MKKRPYRRYPWTKLNIDDSFVDKKADESAIRAAASFAGRRLHKYFSVQIIARNKFKVTRLPLSEKPPQKLYPWPKKKGGFFFLPGNTPWPAQKVWQAGKRRN